MPPLPRRASGMYLPRALGKAPSRRSEDAGSPGMAAEISRIRGGESRAVSRWPEDARDEGRPSQSEPPDDDVAVEAPRRGGRSRPSGGAARRRRRPSSQGSMPSRCNRPSSASGSSSSRAHLRGGRTRDARTWGATRSTCALNEAGSNGGPGARTSAAMPARPSVPSTVHSVGVDLLDARPRRDLLLDLEGGDVFALPPERVPQAIGEVQVSPAGRRASGRRC